MYAIVLLTAINSGVMAPDFGRRGGGCCGCYGGGYYAGCWGCYGGYAPVVYGCYGGYAPVMTSGNMSYTEPAGGGTDGTKKVTEEEKGGKKKVKEGEGGKKKVTDTDKDQALNGASPLAPAVIDVTVPAGARIYFDNEPTTSLSAHRVFVTPSLKAGKLYQYELTGEIVRNGKVVRVHQSVEVRSARTTHVRVVFPETPTVAVTLR